MGEQNDGNQNDGQQGNQQQNAGGQNGGQTGSTGQQQQNLLDDEANQQGQQGQNDGGNNDGGDDKKGGSNNGPTDQDAIVAAVTKALESKFDSIADRRVNALLKAQQKQSGQQNDDGKGGDKNGQQKSAPAGPDVYDVREARAEYRESIGDEITFLGSDERGIASDLAHSMIQNRLTNGADPADVGTAVAKEVGTKIKSLRKYYEDKTIAALRRKGLLAADGRGDGQPKAGDKNAPSETGFKTGSDKAKELFATRFKDPQQAR